MGSVKSIRLFTFIAISIRIAAAQTPAEVSNEPQSIRSIFDSALASQPAAASTTTVSHAYTIAHFPFGGGYSTRIVLANSGTSDATVDIAFFSQTGVPALVPLEGQQGLQDTQHLQIKKNQVQVIDSDPSQRNSGPTTVTWATAKSTAPLNVFSLFDYAPSTKPTTQPATAIRGAVGAQSTAAAKTFRFPVSLNGPLGYNAGIAVANPNSSNTTVTMKLLESDGTIKSTVTKTLPPKGQESFVVTDPAIFGHDIDSSKIFNGSLAVCANQAVGFVTIGVEGGAFFTISVTNDPCP